MKFQVFKDGKAAEDFSLSAAYMFGADAIAVRSADNICFKKGMIECKKKSSESTGLALLWPVEGFGRILLPTTRLPDRKKPYNLNIELARAKLMQITLKREDWSLFEETNGFAMMAHQARELFIEALGNISDPEKASKLADESLRKALVFSEKLASRHGEVFLDARCKNKGLGRHSLGCTIDPKQISNEKYIGRLLDLFGFVTMPINWAEIELKRGEFDFSQIDHCIDSFAGKKLAVCAGPVICFSKEYLPKWLLDGGFEFEKIREIVYGFVSKIVTRYKCCIHAWRVISGMNAENYFDFSFEQIIEMTRTVCLAARASEDKSKKIVEILFPWGEYYAHNRNAIPPLVYADIVIQSAISFDAFSLQLCFGSDYPGMHIRDMMQISSRLDCFSPVSKPIHISAVAVPGSCDAEGAECQAAGMWHKKWNELVQSKWIEQIYKIALGKPFINSITYSNLADAKDLDVPASGLLNENLEPKRAYIAIAKLQQMILKR